MQRVWDCNAWVSEAKADGQETCKVQVPEGGVAWGGHQPYCTQLLTHPGLHCHSTVSQPLRQHRIVDVTP